MPRIAITMGDVNGIGPEILARALGRKEIRGLAEFVVYGDASVFDAAVALTSSGAGLRAREISPFGRGDTSAGLEVVNADSPAPAVEAGVLSAAAGACAHAWISAAVAAVQQGDADALVTCPINKEAMLLAGHDDLGHTELLARLTGCHDWRMCLYTREKLVVHLTGHVSTAEALRHITEARVCESVRMAQDALMRAGNAEPRIAVAGINPHAGEHGIIGKEDGDILVPAIGACVAEGIDCRGPVSPDAVFRQLWEGGHDAVIAMYHDQGHIAMKMVAMDEGVSLTLGLPFVRTSPDHGTAFDIAWQGVAREDSLCEAIRLAAKLAGEAA